MSSELREKYSLGFSPRPNKTVCRGTNLTVCVTDDSSLLRKFAWVRRLSQEGMSTLSPLISVLLLVLSFSANAVESKDWSGVWDTQWRGGGAVMELRQEGSKVRGTYPGFDGTVLGQVDKDQLSGTWSDSAGSGVFTFVMSPDGNSFMGRFGTGEWWTGLRTDKEMQDTLFGSLDASSPELTLLSFLKAGNKAGEGRSDRLGVVFPLLDFSSFDEPLTPYERVDLARLLFQIIDRLTFRIWELRPDADAESAGEYSVDLAQSGTNHTVTLRFQFDAHEHDKGDSVWRLVVPAEDEMRATLATLLEARGGAVPHTHKHHELGSPRDTMRTFLEQWKKARLGNRDLFLETMDLSQIAAPVREEEGFLLGEYLIEVLYRVGLPLRQEITDNPDRKGVYTHFVHPAGEVELQRIAQEDGTYKWQFSADTMANARQLFMAMEDMPLAEAEQRGESTPFFDIRNQARSIHRDLLQDTGSGVEVWQWVAMVLLLAISIPLSFFITWLADKIFQLNKTEDHRTLSPEARFIWPLRLILVAGLGLVALRTLGLPQAVDIPLRVFMGATLSIAGGWIAYHLVDKFSDMLDARSQSYRKYQDEILHSLAISIVKLAVVIGAILFLAEILSIPYQGVIAGLGIGGIAIALAARSTLENLIGGITLYADKPVEIGDFCRIGDHLGVVERIGLRSVRVRSLDRTVVTIPNAEFVNMNIENLTRRERILLNTTVGVRLETTPDQLRWLLVEIRALLLKHPMITAEPARARFAGFGNHSVNIEIFAYVETNDWNEFLAVQEDVFLRLIEIVEESGTTFALPSAVNYLTRDHGVNSSRTERTEAIIEELRNGQKLPFPEFDVRTRGDLRDSLDYPPEGSVDFARRERA